MGFCHSNGHGNFRGPSLVSQHPLELPPLNLFILVASLYPRGQSQSSFDHESEEVKDLRETDRVLLASWCRKNVPLSPEFLISVHFLLINTWQKKKGSEVSEVWLPPLLCTPPPLSAFQHFIFPWVRALSMRGRKIARNECKPETPFLPLPT